MTDWTMEDRTLTDWTLQDWTLQDWTLTDGYGQLIIISEHSKTSEMHIDRQQYEHAIHIIWRLVY